MDTASSDSRGAGGREVRILVLPWRHSDFDHQIQGLQRSPSAYPGTAALKMKKLRVKAEIGRLPR